jgi:hypothetical protein
MPYVMVPVPEEHVQDVMQFVLREVAKSSLEPWDEKSISEFFHDIDEESRSVLAYAARATISGKELSEADAADLLQLRQREMAGIMRDLNERAVKANHANLLSTRTITETLPNRRTVEKRVLWMSEDLASLVHSAERAELADVRAPLGDRSG